MLYFDRTQALPDELAFKPGITQNGPQPFPPSFGTMFPQVTGPTLLI